jgi:hypothetical protein
MRFLNICLIILVYSWNHNLAIAAELNPFTIEYQVYARGLYLGDAIMSLKSTSGNNYVLESKTNSSGLVAIFRKDSINEFSRFKFTSNHIQPQEYSYQQKTGSRERSQHIQFNWQQNSAHGVKDGREWEIRLQPKVLDRISYQLALILDMRRGEQNLNYKVADDGKIKLYQFRQIATETLNTPLGKLETIVLERIPNSDERHTKLWCAPALQFSAVKIEHLEKGDTIKFELKTATGL